MCWGSSVFWDMTLWSLLKVIQCFRGTCHLHLQGWRISQARRQHESRCVAYFSTLKMEATCSSEMLVVFQQAMWCYIPIHDSCCENLKSRKRVVVIWVQMTVFLPCMLHKVWKDITVPRIGEFLLVCVWYIYRII
jgi:hypothetical protein